MKANLNNITSLGTEYGKHYVLPELLNQNSIIYSGGVGEDISFDIELINLTKCQVWGFDPTPKAKSYIETKQNNNELPSNYNFIECGISYFDGNSTFNSPDNPNHASYKEHPTGSFSFSVKKISTFLKELNHNHIDLLKLDIEGSEYSVLNDILQESILPTQMSIEFHGETKDIVNWIKTNSILKNKYEGLSFPNKGNSFLDTFFLLKK